MNRQDGKEKNKNMQMLSYVLMIAVTAQMKIQVGEGIATGFVLALDVVVLGAYLYYQSSNITVLNVIILTAIVSPSARFLFSYSIYPSITLAVKSVFPDAIFFISYGIIICLLKTLLGKGIKSYVVYFAVISLCDFTGNTCEYLCRGLIFGEGYSWESSLSTFMFMGMFRSVIVFLILLIIKIIVEYNLKNERWKNVLWVYDSLTTLSEEIVMMQKNSEEVERVMRKAYDLNTELAEGNYPEHLQRQAQELAVRTHEIKGEYQNLMLVINEIFASKDEESSMEFELLCRVVLSNVAAFKMSRSHHAILSMDIAENFIVKEPYKMLSIIRNLVTNAVEAVGSSYEEVKLYTLKTQEDGKDKYIIGVKDYGPGIDESDIDNIFISGYSTKFNMETGYIQRGLGLYLVKQYVEEDYEGRIEVNSKLGKYTDFRLIIDCDKFERIAEEQYEKRSIYSLNGNS